MPRTVHLLRAIRYLGRLKGLSFAEAEERAAKLLKRVYLYEHRSKKSKAFPDGITQFARFAAALIHHPGFIILEGPSRVWTR